MTGFIIFGGILAILLSTIVWAAIRGGEDTGAALGAAERRDAALEALRDLELDHRTGKLSEEEYRQLRDRLERTAVHARAEAASGAATLPAEAPATGPEPPPSNAQHPAPAADPPAAAADPPKFCTSCGAALEAGGRFCPACGASLAVQNASSAHPQTAIPTSITGDAVEDPDDPPERSEPPEPAI